MAITVDVAIEAVRTDTSSPFNFTTTGAAASGIKGVVLSAVHGVSSTDHVTAVSYGGVALSRIKRNVDTSTEPGASELWFLGASVPQGAQTVSVTCGATTDDFHFVAITLLAATNLEVVDSDGIDNNVANPSVTLQYAGRSCMSFAALYGGGADGGSFAPNANCTTVHDHDLGAFYSEIIRQTTAGTADFAIGGTSGTDDVAFAAMAVSEALRRAQTSWAELETPNAPRRAFVSFAELETPNAPRRAFVSYAEFEVPTAPRRALTSWAELEVPDEPNPTRRAFVSYAEFEVPTAPRRAFVSFSELEIPTAPRRALVSWVELQTDNAPRRAQVSWAEIEIPTAPRRALLSFAELQVPNSQARAYVSWAEFQVPSVGGSGTSSRSWVGLGIRIR